MLLLVAGTVAFAQRPMGNMRGGGFGGARGANNSNGYLSGTVMLNPDNEGEEPFPGEGAVVIVSFEKKANNLANIAAQKAAGDKPIMDSLFTQVGSTGNFMIRNVPTGTATIKISLIGYEEMVRAISINPGENKMQVYLTPEKLALTQSVVTAKVPPLSIVNDTIVMNASAVKFNKGEMAIDILEQMPGVQNNNGSVTVLGEAVSNVYVDGVLLFGNSPMTALNNLPAEEVVSIKSFQEYANKDPRHKISQTESKERVLDISTKSKASFVVNGNVLAGGGYDTDTTYHKFRYTSGLDVIATSEKLQINASVNANNINNSATRMRGAMFGGVSGGGSPDLRNISASLNVTKKWMSKTTKNFVLGQINAGYSYSSSYNVNESRSETIYFPDHERGYDAREAYSDSKSITESGRHNFNLGGTKNIADGSISLDGSYSISDNLSQSYSSNYNIQKPIGASDFLPKQGTATGTDKTTKGTSYSLNFNARKGFWNVLRVGMNASMGESTSDAFSTKRDTTTSTITNTVLDIQTNAPSRNYRISPNVRLEIGDRQSLSLSYSYRETFNQTEQVAYNVTDPANKVIDEINTNTMTNDNDTHSAEIEYNNALWKDGPVLRASLEYASVGLAKEERYPQNGVEISDPYDHRFNSWSPSIRIGTEGMMNRWNISYSSSASTPSLEQVRPRLNNTNLYNVRGGNPNLKQSRSHRFNASFSTPLGDFDEAVFSQDISTISISASFSLNQNRIASNSIYFSQASSLAEFGYPEYTMPAQSTFTTYVNVPDAYSANGSVRYDTEIPFIRCNLNTNLSMSWDDTPEFVNNKLTRTTNYSPNVSIGIRSNFSRDFRFNINGRGSYIYSYNTAKNKTEYFTESVTAGVELNNILQKGYVSGNYTKSFTQGIERANINDNILDLRSGLRFGPRNNVDISMMIHDIFNATSGFTTSMSNDYITNRWSHNFGRYILFSISYSFNSLSRRSSGNNNSNDRGPMPGFNPGMMGGFGPGMMGGGGIGGGRMGGGGFGGGRR